MLSTCTCASLSRVCNRRVYQLRAVEASRRASPAPVEWRFMMADAGCGMDDHCPSTTITSYQVLLACLPATLPIHASCMSTHNNLYASRACETRRVKKQTDQASKASQNLFLSQEREPAGNGDCMCCAYCKACLLDSGTFSSGAGAADVLSAFLELSSRARYSLKAGRRSRSVSLELRSSPKCSKVEHKWHTQRLRGL